MSNIQDFMQVRPKFEADCVIGEGDTEPYLISIAISLKRIADALQAVEAKALVAAGDGGSAF